MTTTHQGLSDPVSELRALSDQVDPHKKAYLFDYIARHIRPEDLGLIARRMLELEASPPLDMSGHHDDPMVLIETMALEMYRDRAPFVRTSDGELRCPRCTDGDGFDYTERALVDVRGYLVQNQGLQNDSYVYEAQVYRAPFYFRTCDDCGHYALIDAISPQEEEEEE